MTSFHLAVVKLGMHNVAVVTLILEMVGSVIGLSRCCLGFSTNGLLEGDLSER